MISVDEVSWGLLAPTNRVFGSGRGGRGRVGRRLRLEGVAAGRPVPSRSVNRRWRRVEGGSSDRKVVSLDQEQDTLFDKIINIQTEQEASGCTALHWRAFDFDPRGSIAGKRLRGRPLSTRFQFDPK